ncbi:MAG: hypothetical protein JO056_05110 [Alphaproteobacteria bacterium]|nr:hypothetical protein [Alphaproteobacteria bacterium]
MEQLLELARERKLDRVGATYAVVAWVVVQAASIAFPVFSAPPWALRWLIVGAMAGLPLVLAATWVAGRRVAPAPRPIAAKDWLLIGLIGLVAVLLIVQLVLGFERTSGPDRPQAMAASSIAVLPFVNLSGDPNKLYFSDGIADQLISELARTPSLRVAARSSSFAFRGKAVDVKAIAKALNVRAVLEGSVREDGNRVRIAAELVDASNGYQIWSETYDRNLTNILALQDDISHAIIETLSKRFWGRPVVATPRPAPRAINPEAYKAYLQGEYYFAQRTSDGVARAIALFARATELAPDYAEAFAALGYARATNALNYQAYGDTDHALAAVKKAQALDPNNATALIAHATACILKWRWRDIAADFRRLERLHVNSAAVWHLRAIFFDYMGLTQFTGAAEAKAVQLDPLSFIDRYNLALYALTARHYDEAMKIAAEAQALQPGNLEVVALQCSIEAARNRTAEARRLHRQLLSRASPGEPSADALSCQYYIAVAEKKFAVVRQVADAAAAAFPAKDIPATDIAIAYGHANDVDAAIKWFRRAFEIRDPQSLRVPHTEKNLPNVFADPRWKALRNEPAIRDFELARREIAAENQAGE